MGVGVGLYPYMAVTYPVRQLIAVSSGADGTRAEKKSPRKTDLHKF